MRLALSVRRSAVRNPLRLSGDRMDGITVRLYLAAILRTGAVGWALSSWTLLPPEWPACEEVAGLIVDRQEAAHSIGISWLCLLRQCPRGMSVARDRSSPGAEWLGGGRWCDALGAGTIAPAGRGSVCIVVRS